MQIPTIQDFGHVPILSSHIYTTDKKSWRPPSECVRSPSIKSLFYFLCVYMNIKKYQSESAPKPNNVPKLTTLEN
jgi:hypothetical protein